MGSGGDPAYDVAVLGSGFAGSILARCLAVRGKKVALIERGRHPRFALGESSTPLAALSLERLADDYGLRDLWSLAAYGRWKQAYPRLLCGLKRGFTFYSHERGQEYDPGRANANRLLVAASPNDSIADCQWLRADADHHLARAAVAAGASLLEETTVAAIERCEEGFEMRLDRVDRGSSALRARFLVDATGPGGALSSLLGLGDDERDVAFSSRLLYGHVHGLAAFRAVATGAWEGTDPYPEQWSAVHHLLAEGWMYQLRFDDERTSVGAVLFDRPRGSAQNEWDQLLGAYPTLARQFADASFDGGIRSAPRLQFRRRHIVGDGWLRLPSSVAFYDPMFSVGMAWSLVAVERVAAILGQGRPTADQLTRYRDVIELEADHLERLFAATYLALGQFSLLRSVAFFYFAAASYSEARQRLVQGVEHRWSGFLGANDEVLGPLALELLQALQGSPQPAALEALVAGRAGERDVAGLFGMDHTNLVPVDLETLVDSAGRLGLAKEEVVAALPRLRGDGAC